MPGVLNNMPRLALFLAGLAAGALSGSRRERGGAESKNIDEIKDAIAKLEARLSQQEANSVSRLQVVESRLDEHAAKLVEVPTTAQIVTAMEQVLARSMASLDERLATQAYSIEVLKTTVSQTDSLLERVLESLDSLQSQAEPSEISDVLVRLPAV